MNVPTLFSPTEPAPARDQARGDGTVFQAKLLDFLCHGWADAKGDASDGSQEMRLVTDDASATLPSPSPEMSEEEDLEKLMPLEAMPFLVDVNDWFASSKLEAARPLATSASGAGPVTVVPTGAPEAGAAASAEVASLMDWNITSSPMAASVMPPASADAPRRSAQPETFAERVARGSSSRPRITPVPLETLKYDASAFQASGSAAPHAGNAAAHARGVANAAASAVSATARAGAPNHAAQSHAARNHAQMNPAIAGIASAAFDVIPLAATPRGLSAAIPESSPRKTPISSVDAAGRGTKAVTREEIARQVNAIDASSSRDARAVEPGFEAALAGVGNEIANGDGSKPERTEEAAALPAANDVIPSHLLKPAEEGPLREAVLRAVEREVKSRDTAEVRQRDVEASVDSMTLRHGVVARTVLETGDRLEVSVRNEERGMDVAVKVDSREAAELIALVRHDLIADLDANRVARVTVSHDASLGQSGDRRHEGQRDSRPQRDAEAPYETVQAPAAPPQTGRVRVVL